MFGRGLGFIKKPNVSAAPLAAIFSGIRVYPTRVAKRQAHSTVEISDNMVCCAVKISEEAIISYCNVAHSHKHVGNVGSCYVERKCRILQASGRLER